MHIALKAEIKNSCMSDEIISRINKMWWYEYTTKRKPTSEKRNNKSNKKKENKDHERNAHEQHMLQCNILAESTYAFGSFVYTSLCMWNYVYVVTFVVRNISSTLYWQRFFIFVLINSDFHNAAKEFRLSQCRRWKKK